MRSSSLILWVRRVTRVHLPAIDYDVSKRSFMDMRVTCYPFVQLKINEKMKNADDRFSLSQV